MIKNTVTTSAPDKKYTFMYISLLPCLDIICSLQLLMNQYTMWTRIATSHSLSHRHNTYNYICTIIMISPFHKRVHCVRRISRSLYAKAIMSSRTLQKWPLMVPCEAKFCVHINFNCFSQWLVFFLKQMLSYAV